MDFNFKDKTMPFWDSTGNTVAVYESIRMDDPTGPLADDATMATANTLFLKGRYEDAGYHYDLMRTEFPQSEFQAQAHLLGMQSKLQSYQGPQYDDKPLMRRRQAGQNDSQTQYAAPDAERARAYRRKSRKRSTPSWPSAIGRWASSTTRRSITARPAITTTPC